MPLRAFWLALGVVATALGVVGAFLPLLPTTPFLLLAAYAFSRSSPRLHAWLLTHPRLGPPINRWQAHGAISRQTKVVAVVVMLASLAASALSGVRGTIVVVQAIVLLCAAAFILTRPDGPSDPR